MNRSCFVASYDVRRDNFKYEREGDVQITATPCLRHYLKRTDPNVIILRQEMRFVCDLKMGLLPGKYPKSYRLDNPHPISDKKRK